MELKIIITVLFSFLTAYVSLPVILYIAYAKKLFDNPNVRKIHTLPVPPLGGVAVFIALFLGSMLTISPVVENFNYYFASLFMLFMLGLKDDLVGTAATKKFIFQLAAALIVVFFCRNRILSFYNFLGIGQVSPMFGLVFTVFLVVLVINAYNLIDGIDGLSVTQGTISCIIYGIALYYWGDLNHALLAFAMASALIAFGIFNFHPAKIFLGDNGSYVMGMLIAILALRSLSYLNQPLMGMEVKNAPLLAFAPAMVPLIDTVRLFSGRILKSISPFEADRNHIHHVFMDLGLNPMMISIVMMLFTLTNLFILLVCISVNINISILIILLYNSIVYFILGYYRRKYRKPLAVDAQTNPEE
jgi:UDP-GlcNAc:undecaprenyl-phosphate GlcNAc-1-phosphate transferase